MEIHGTNWVIQIQLKKHDDIPNFVKKLGKNEIDVMHPTENLPP